MAATLITIRLAFREFLILLFSALLPRLLLAALPHTGHLDIGRGSPAANMLPGRLALDAREHPVQK